MQCPECKMETTVDGRCITLGCIHYRWPPYWQTEQVEEEIPIEEGNWLA